MNRLPATRKLGLFAFATVVASIIALNGAQAQKFGDGTTPTADVVDDGFRPVWAQQRARVTRPAPRARVQPQRIADNKVAAPEALPANMTIHGRWTVTCNDKDADKTKRDCSAALRIVDGRQQLVILWQIGKGRDGALVASLQTPTGVLVQRGVDLKLGETRVGRFDYAACVPQNCEAGGALDEALLTKIAEASEMVITIHSKDGRDVNFKFPVNGIDEALAAIRS